MLANRRLLVMEDSLEDIQMIKRHTSSLQLEMKSARTIDEGLELLRTEPFDFLLSDLHIESIVGVDIPDGFRLISEALELQPNLTVLAMSTDPRADIWQSAKEAGAQHFIRKPILRADELVIAFASARERKNLLTRIADPLTPQKHALLSPVFEKFPEGIIIDPSDLKKVKGLARRKNLDSVIMGETGTGKEEVARLIHRYRCQEEGEVPFVAVNCATITSSLAESLLFGHKKGAFTGADATTEGFIGKADGGILFLDEIHSLDLSCQQKLLRVLSDGSYSRLGDSRVYTSSFQLIAATTKDLDDEVDHGNFLIDLRSRITGVDISLPPLRQRPDYIGPLLMLFLARNSITLSHEDFKEVKDYLTNFYWRGNIRQFFKVLASWVAICDFQELPLIAKHIPVNKLMTSQGPSHAVAIDPSNLYLHVPGVFPLVDGDFNLAVEAFEKALLKAAMERHKSPNASAAALKLPRSTFDSKRNKYNLSF